jgi:hypothetical protein
LPGSPCEDKSAATVPFRAPPCLEQAGWTPAPVSCQFKPVCLVSPSHGGDDIGASTVGTVGALPLPPILSTIQRPDDRTDDRASGADDVASGSTLRKLRFQMIDDTRRTSDEARTRTTDAICRICCGSAPVHGLYQGTVRSGKTSSRTRVRASDERQTGLFQHSELQHARAQGNRRQGWSEENGSADAQHGTACENGPDSDFSMSLADLGSDYLAGNDNLHPAILLAAAGGAVVGNRHRLAESDRRYSRWR